MNPTLAYIGLWIFVVSTVAGGFGAAAQETNRANPRDFSAFKLITDRNIFDPNRRPSRANNPRQERAAVDSFSLSGTLSYSNVLLAIFDGTKPDYHKALKTGDPIAGYAVTGIARDAVKLLSGTNQVELKVGMQMRRSEDGKWSVAEGSGAYGSSYASDSRRRSSDRRESGSSRSSAGRNRSPGESQPGGTSENQSATNPPPEMAGGPPSDLPPGGEMDAPPAAPPDAGGANADDPVARMMQRRLQETGGNPNENEN
jgi:hypothetical protein